MIIHLVDKKGESKWYENVKICHVSSDMRDTMVSALEHEKYIQIRCPEMQAIDGSVTIK